MSDLTIRLSGPGDDAALRRIAERDSAEPLPAGALAAETGGRLVAAICIESRRVVADPFTPTADAVEMLRRRADQLRPARRRPLRMPLSAGRRPTRSSPAT